MEPVGKDLHRVLGILQSDLVLFFASSVLGCFGVQGIGT